jgi:hypothetical protein
MRNTKGSSLKLGGRKPYEPIRTALEIPPALFEVSTLIEKGLAGDRASLEKASALQESIIAVALDHPDCLTQIRNLISNGYVIEFSMVQSVAENHKTSENLSPLSA